MFNRIVPPGKGLGDAFAGHNWYPSARRCGCGLALLTAERWVEHLGLVANGRGTSPAGS